MCSSRCANMRAWRSTSPTHLQSAGNRVVGADKPCHSGAGEHAAGSRLAQQLQKQSAHLSMTSESTIPGDHRSNATLLRAAPFRDQGALRRWSGVNRT